MDKPILFSAPMILAILREIEAPGTGKTQTRRVLKPQPPDGAQLVSAPFRGDGKDLHIQFTEIDGLPGKSQPVPYRPGDKIWVREAWGCSHRGDSTPGGRPYDPVILYQATDDAPTGCEAAVQWEPFKWSPSIHMPRWASRITLDVTEVRVRRLQEITPADARAGGHLVGPANYPQEVHDDAARDWFMDLWDSLNANRPGCSWLDNPWVVAVTFKPRLVNIDQVTS